MLYWKEPVFYCWQSLFARNFYNFKYVALFLAFIINFMLLFYKVWDTCIKKNILPKISKYMYLKTTIC